MRKFIYFLLFISISLIIYSRYYEHTKLTYNEYTISSNIIPDSFDSFKIVHFSDFLFPNTTTLEHLKTLVNKINAQNPDIVIFTGNLIDKNHDLSVKNKNEITTLLNKINPSLQKYAIYGNHDLKHKAVYKKIMEETNFILLDDEEALLFYKENEPIKIKGYNKNTQFESNVEYVDAYSIALVHKPDNVNNIEDFNNLYLSGHSLGGYINLLVTDPLIKKEGATIFTKGKYKINNSLLFVSSGLGTDHINFRFMNYPSFNIYMLKKTTK